MSFSPCAEWAQKIRKLGYVMFISESHLIKKFVKSLIALIIIYIIKKTLIYKARKNWNPLGMSCIFRISKTIKSIIHLLTKKLQELQIENIMNS